MIVKAVTGKLSQITAITSLVSILILAWYIEKLDSGQIFYLAIAGILSLLIFALNEYVKYRKSGQAEIDKSNALSRANDGELILAGMSFSQFLKVEAPTIFFLILFGSIISDGSILLVIGFCLAVMVPSIGRYL